jgi:uncharacterized Zn finger protein
MSDAELCEYCQIGYHMPFERFERIAVREDGPSFLQKCQNCGTLWDEQLHGAGIIAVQQAAARYPDFKP